MAKRQSSKANDDGDINCIDAGKVSPITDTAHHDALKAFAEWEGSESGIGEIICEHFTLMKGSPYYRSFLERAKQPVKHLDDPDWNLVWSHATMIAVGILIARREFGLRKPSVYDAELDLSDRVSRSLCNERKARQQTRPVSI